MFSIEGGIIVWYDAVKKSFFKMINRGTRKRINIDIPHFYCLEYIENEKRMYVDIDFREPKIYIGKSLIKKWEPPYESEEITEEMREEIYKNIKKYLLDRFSSQDILEIY
jgi:hypothetical protein